MRKIKRTLHHFFIPSETNNFRAKTLHIDSLFAYIFLVLAFSIFFKSSFGTRILGYATNVSVSTLFELVNKERSARSIPLLSSNDLLSLAAGNKANDMFAKNYWAHISPDGTTPWFFIQNAGYNYEAAGENLAEGYNTSEEIVRAWMDSPTHAENILNPTFTQMGFSVVNGVLEGEEVTLVVQMFGKPVSNTASASNSESSSQGIQAYAKEDQKQLLLPTTTPTLAPSQTPYPTFIEYPAKANAKLTASSSTISVKRASMDTSFFIIGLLMIALIIDLIYAYKIGVLRVNGKNIAHILFLLAIGASIVLLTSGKIL